jgi:hypothetical protein
MEEVCELIANKWNDFKTEYVEQTIDDEMKLQSNESAVIYIISQLNINLGEAVYEITSNEDESIVSFKYKGVNFSIREWFHSRGYAYWVVEKV